MKYLLPKFGCLLAESVTECYVYVSLMEQQFVITHRYAGDSKELSFTGERQELILQEIVRT